MASTKTKNADGSAANLGFEAKLWLTADKLHEDIRAELPSEVHLDCSIVGRRGRGIKTTI